VGLRSGGTPYQDERTGDYVVASPDQNGDLLVDALDLATIESKLGAFDPTADATAASPTRIWRSPRRIWGTRHEQ